MEYADHQYKIFTFLCVAECTKTRTRELEWQELLLFFLAKREDAGLTFAACQEAPTTWDIRICWNVSSGLQIWLGDAVYTRAPTY